MGATIIAVELSAPQLMKYYKPIDMLCCTKHLRLKIAPSGVVLNKNDDLVHLWTIVLTEQNKQYYHWTMWKLPLFSVSGQGEQFSSTSLDDPNRYLSTANLNEHNYQSRTPDWPRTN